MTRLAAAFALAALTGCAVFERPTYREPDPTPVQLPPPPPERILRQAPDFRFTDAATGKIFVYRGYRETLPGGGEFRHEIITVRDPGADLERNATDEEREFALETLERDWRNRGLEEQVRTHEDMVRRGRERRDTLIDLKIVYAEKAATHLEEEIAELDADFQASTRTAGYQAPPGRVEFLQREIAQKKGELAETKSKLESLRFLKADRDRAYGTAKSGS